LLRDVVDSFCSGLDSSKYHRDNAYSSYIHGRVAVTDYPAKLSGVSVSGAGALVCIAAVCDVCCSGSSARLGAVPGINGSLV